MRNLAKYLTTRAIDLVTCILRSDFELLSTLTLHQKFPQQLLVVMAGVQLLDDARLRWLQQER